MKSAEILHIFQQIYSDTYNGNLSDDDLKYLCLDEPTVGKIALKLCSGVGMLSGLPSAKNIKEAIKISYQLNVLMPDVDYLSKSDSKVWSRFPIVECGYMPEKGEFIRTGI